MGKEWEAELPIHTFNSTYTLTHTHTHFDTPVELSRQDLVVFYGSTLMSCRQQFHPLPSDTRTRKLSTLTLRLFQQSSKLTEIQKLEEEDADSNYKKHDRRVETDFEKQCIHCFTE